MPFDQHKPSYGRTQSAYAAAGVDIDAANKAVEQMKAHITSTRLPGVLSSSTGNFGGMFSLGEAMVGMTEPVLVSSIDGVGTKLNLAFLTGRHAVVAGDLVNHCINDILVQGAKPLFFLDYFSTGQLEPHVAVEVVAGMSQACRMSGCVLIGGETAEMPGLYDKGEYDMAGCIVGLVDRPRIVTGERIVAGDVVLGLASEGLHTNGYSLARRVLLDQANMDLSAPLADAPGLTYEDALLARHRCYAPAILPILAELPNLIKGMAHITGGGIVENLPRTLPEGLGAKISLNSWTVPPIFRAIQSLGQVQTPEMYRVFNMGIGYVVIVAARDAARATERLQAAGETVMRIGTVEPGSDVTLV